jgi:hypothetical protein
VSEREKCKPYLQESFSSGLREVPQGKFQERSIKSRTKEFQNIPGEQGTMSRNPLCDLIYLIVKKEAPKIA